jgi:hypothetical protein
MNVNIFWKNLLFTANQTVTETEMQEDNWKDGYEVRTGRASRWKIWEFIRTQLSLTP